MIRSLVSESQAGLGCEKVSVQVFYFDLIPRTTEETSVLGFFFISTELPAAGLEINCCCNKLAYGKNVRGCRWVWIQSSAEGLVRMASDTVYSGCGQVMFETPINYYTGAHTHTQTHYFL